MSAFEDYFKDLQGHKIDEITEHSHRKSLQNLLESIAAKQKSKFKILHEPKREGKFGSPDFKVTSNESVLGYVENKKVDENLDKTLKTDQVKKYIELSNNILLTNYIEWIWIKNGEVTAREVLCSKTDIENRKIKLDLQKAEKVESLIAKFFSEPPQKISNAKLLAEALAIRAKLLKDFLHEELIRQEKEHTEGRLYQLFETFRSFVFQELKLQEFADAFAQNLVYGLFLAKLNADTKTIDIYNAKKFIPNSFELIRELVNFLDELDNEEYKETKWIVEEVLAILNNLDLREINKTLHFSKTKTTNLFGENEYFYKDPFVYFYEHFLSVYDKKLRKAKGVYYTPPPVVNFIVRAVNDVLKDTFKIKEGFANKEKVTVLDFATGTGTFLLEIFQQIFDTLPKGSAKKDALIKDHILKNIYGFEYLIAPYTIAHLKLSQFLKDQGYNLQPKERLQIFLTNSLVPLKGFEKDIAFLPALTKESREAQEVKDMPILVITGNPPYSGHSKNNGPWISAKIKDYFLYDGKPLGERNPKWLQDDYVKFFRFAQDKMDNVEEGVVAIITNHRFLTNPTFRGMRQSLMKTFDHMYFIDMHGSNKPKEVTPNGTKDENVFDIEQGVAISILIKKKGLEKKVFHTDFWGLREEKYRRSVEDDIKKINWDIIKPSKPFHLFKPQNDKLKSTYESFWGIKKIFKLSNTGIVSSRDSIVIDFDNDVLTKRINEIKNGDSSTISKYSLKDTREKSIQESLNELKAIKNVSTLIKRIEYRPFDFRYIFYDKSLVRWPVHQIMGHLLSFENISINVGRAGLNVETNVPWNLVQTSNHLVDYNQFSRGGALVCPLYLSIDGKKELNFTIPFTEFINLKYKNISPEDFFFYTYSILHSPSYREKYNEFLKIDFPRIPFTEDKKLLSKLSRLGQKLTDAHLLKETNDFNDELGNYMGGKNHEVEKPLFQIEKGIGKLYINSTNYFNNVPEKVYSFQSGGYKVLEKYLKERKGRMLDSKEMDQIENIIRSLAFTIETMKEIDKLTKDWI